MDQVAKLASKERSELFTETSANMGMTPNIIEKDFWVCWTLDKIFSTPSISKKVMFKGGTSLSKVFGLIERFSEDIDLILDWNEITDVDPMEKRSKSKQENFNREIVGKSQEYIKEQLYPQLEKCLSNICALKVDEKDPNTINLSYPGAFPAGFLRPEIKLEIGPLAIWVPNETYNISSYAAQQFPHVFKQVDCQVRAIKAERTFWEKATILHHEANRPESIPQPSRYSRHYYDLAMMVNSKIKETALTDLELLKSVVESKIKFYPRGWAKYELAKPGTLKLIPPDFIKGPLKKDYAEMRNMIFGEYLEFDEILEIIENLQEEVNKLKE